MSFTISEIVGKDKARDTREITRLPDCPVTGKKSFRTREIALAVARIVNRGERRANRAYRCDWCGHVHIGRRR